VSPRLVLVSRWRLDPTRERLWELLSHPEHWPGWWPHLASVEPLAPGNADGIDARRRFRWRSGLGYGFSVVMTTIRSERLREIEAAAAGDLRGIGLWVIDEDAPGAVRLTYRWDVELARPWMGLAAPLLRPVFAWRHFAVMASGARGMARRLGCRLGEIEEWSTITCLAPNETAPRAGGPLPGVSGDSR
jgi:hypothetical protein